MELNGQVLQWGCYLRVGKFSLLWHQYSEVWISLWSSKCYFVEIQKVWFLAYYLSRVPLTWWDSTILPGGSSFQTSVHCRRKYLQLRKTGNSLQSACCFLTGAHKLGFNSKTPQMLSACFSFAMYEQSPRSDRGNITLTCGCIWNIFDSWLCGLVVFIYWGRFLVCNGETNFSIMH